MKYEDLLRTLDLEEFKEAFHDNNIDDESVLLLGDAELKELIPKIGPRLKFKKLLDELKLEAAQDVTLTNWKTLRKIHYKKTKVAAEWRISWYKQTSFIVFFRKHIVTSNFNFDSGDNSDNNEPNDYVENLTFLKNNVEPWGKVEEIWSATSSCRLKNLYRKNNSGIHLKYPALRQPQGYILVPYWLRCSKSMVRPTYVELQHWYRTGSGVAHVLHLYISRTHHAYTTPEPVRYLCCTSL
ncbi:hypothetical protein ACJJTC_019255 [Scirpophaga incertulas]